MTSPPRMAIGIPLVACLGLTSCGDKKVARKLKPGDQIFSEPVFNDEEHVKYAGKPYTAEEKTFFHTITRVPFAMSEEEVDAIMSAYHSWQPKNPNLEEDGQYTKLYNTKPNAIEWDYYLQVTFDAEHRLVDAYVGDYLK